MSRRDGKCEMTRVNWRGMLLLPALVVCGLGIAISQSACLYGIPEKSAVGVICLLCC